MSELQQAIENFVETWAPRVIAHGNPREQFIVDLRELVNSYAEAALQHGALPEKGVPHGSYHDGNPNIQIEITDPLEFHCFRLTFNPPVPPSASRIERDHQAFRDYQKQHGATEAEAERRWKKPGYAADLSEALREAGLPGTPAEEQEATPHIEIMLHARSLVDLIHKCSIALSDWQKDTSAYLIERLGAGGGTP